MRTVTVQIDNNTFEVRSLTADGALLGVFKDLQTAVAFSQCYSLGRY